MPDPVVVAAGRPDGSPVRFVRYELRTTDTDAARAFYRSVLADLDDPSLDVGPLPPTARARGAPAHWLGHLAVTDPEAAAAALVAAGGARLGPTRRHADGSTSAVLRDPFGAVLALASGRTTPADTPVRWHVLNVDDPERALAVYAGAFGWTGTEGFDSRSGQSRHLSFTWQASGRSVGSIADTARLPHVHPHWLFLFDVPDVEHAVATVLAHGGTALPTFRTPTGDLAAVCEDPQGATFGLRRPGTEKI